MKLLVRLNLALIVVFAVRALVTGISLGAVAQANAQREIRAEAGLLLDGALREFIHAPRPLLHASG